MKNKIFAIVLAVLFIVSVFSVTVFAEDSESTEAPTLTLTATEGEEVTETGTKEAEEPASTEEVPTTGTTETPTTTTEPAKEEKTWIEKNMGLVVAIAIVLGIVAIFFIVFAASPKFREKVKKFCKDYNAEFKKLVWPTKQQLIRNSSVVLITIVVAGALLALLDLGFSKGFKELKDLIEYIWPAP